MSVNKEDTLRQFCDVTGADETRSRFFLESSNWQLEVALSSFYEHGGNADEAPAHPVAAPAPLPLSDSDMESPPGSPLRQPKKDKKKPTNTKFATLDTLQQQESSSDEEEARLRTIRKIKEIFAQKPTCSKCLDQSPNTAEASTSTATEAIKTRPEEELQFLNAKIARLTRENSELRKEIARMQKLNEESEQGQAFYAGGSERSGQQILGPGKGRKDIVSEMFKSVRERGAVVFEDEPSTASRGRGGAFSGVGYRLGQTSEEPEPAAPANTQQPPSQQEQVRSVRLRLYREGFTVDTGAMRHYSDPDNAEFLTCIRRGEIPPELSGGGGEVRVSLEDRRHDECPRQPGKAQAFTGKGHLLGSPTPPTVGAPTVGSVPADAADRAANQRAAQDAVALDDKKPVTTIQFRLADGSRITGRFNHSHTVADLQQYVSRAEPAYQRAAFALLTTFPSAELADPSVTLAQGNLLNTTLLQRLK